MGSRCSAPTRANADRILPGNVSRASVVQPKDKATKALIKLVIQKLASDDSDPGNKHLMEYKDRVIDELRTILDFVRGEKLGEGSTRQHYLIDDVVEMCLDLLNKKSERIPYEEKEMRSICGWLGEVKTNMLKLGADGAEMRLENVGEEDDDEDEDVGLEDEVEALLRTFVLHEASVDETRRLLTCAITGIAGVGKTALARKVYNHAEVVARFELCGWVCVAEGETNKEVLMQLIQQVVDSEDIERESLSERLEGADNRGLQQMLRSELEGKRYLIVVDNLLQEMCLTSILNGLPQEGIGSRLLLTCRTRNPEIMLPNRYWYRQAIYFHHHQMEPMHFDRSWQLFLKTTSEHEFTKPLEQNGRDMLTRCGGVPSAIKEFGRRLLAEKRRLGSEWEELLQPVGLGAVFEALILPMIHSLEAHRLYMTLTEGVRHDLTMILDVARYMKLRKGSRLYYMICDVLDMAQDVAKFSGAFHIKIKYVRAWSKEVKMVMFELGDDVASSRSEDVGVLEGDDEDVVGLKDDVEALLDRVVFKQTRDNSELRTCMIAGMVGSGKTTLARQVYNHPAVVDRFECRAWVSVSGNLSHKELLMQLIEQVVHREEFERDLLLEKMERPENFTLKETLHKHLTGMRYFIVLDDFPKEMLLEYILQALPHDDKDNESRLLITSRSRNIGLDIHYTHGMKSLDPNKSWQLFLKTISRGNNFTSERKFPKNLEKKGREMLAKCGGLPLAIKDVAQQLATKISLGSEWEELLESIDLSPSLEILELSYDKLDPELKTCFLNLAFFKQSASIRTEKLEQILAVGGMVSKNKIGSYIRMLTEECFAEIKDKKTTNVYKEILIKSCCINAILHTLSIKKAEEGIGLEILRYDGPNRPSKSTHHRLIICSREKFNYSTNQDRNLVSLFFHGGGYFNSSPSYWKSFEELKTLDLEDFGLKILPESIGALMELRYLGLRNNYIQEIPHSLGCLKKLEVLDIALNYMVEMPYIVWEMDKLRHLYMSDVIYLKPLNKPLEMEGLKNLETLTYISVDNYWIQEVSGLQMMRRLRKLGIEEMDENSDVSKLFASLARLGDLRELILRGSRFRNMPCLDELGMLLSVGILKLDGHFAKLPNVYKFPPNMWYLSLVNSCLDEDPMPELAKIHGLTHLKLRNAYTGQRMVILRDTFHQVQDLCIEEMWNLRNLHVEKDAMGYLLKLKIKNCPKLETLPEKLGSMKYLKKFEMLTTKNAAAKVRESNLISKLSRVDSVRVCTHNSLNIA